MHRTKQSLSSTVSTAHKAIKSAMEEKWTEKLAKKSKYIVKGKKKIHQLAHNFTLHSLVL